jgi:hypothetical protein
MFLSSETIPAGVVFKVFVRGDDGQWCIVSCHRSRREAERAADVLRVREGLVARVML